MFGIETTTRQRPVARSVHPIWEAHGLGPHPDEFKAKPMFKCVQPVRGSDGKEHPCCAVFRQCWNFHIRRPMPFAEKVSSGAHANAAYPGWQARKAAADLADRFFHA